MAWIWATESDRDMGSEFALDIASLSAALQQHRVHVLLRWASEMPLLFGVTGSTRIGLSTTLIVANTAFINAEMLRRPPVLDNVRRVMLADMEEVLALAGSLHASGQKFSVASVNLVTQDPLGQVFGKPYVERHAPLVF